MAGTHRGRRPDRRHSWIRRPRRSGCSRRRAVLTRQAQASISRQTAERTPGAALLERLLRSLRLARRQRQASFGRPGDFRLRRRPAVAQPTRLTASDGAGSAGWGSAVRVALVEAVGRSYEVVGGTFITIRNRRRVGHPATRRLGGGANPTLAPLQPTGTARSGSRSLHVLYRHRCAGAAAATSAFTSITKATVASTRAPTPGRPRSAPMPRWSFRLAVPDRRGEQMRTGLGRRPLSSCAWRWVLLWLPVRLCRSAVALPHRRFRAWLRSSPRNGHRPWPPPPVRSAASGPAPGPRRPLARRKAQRRPFLGLARRPRNAGPTRRPGPGSHRRFGASASPDALRAGRPHGMDDHGDTVDGDDEAGLDQRAGSTGPVTKVSPSSSSKTCTGLRNAWSMSSSATPCFRALSAMTGSTHHKLPCSPNRWQVTL